MGILLITHYQRLLNYIKPTVRARAYRRADRPLRRAELRKQLEATATTRYAKPAYSPPERRAEEADHDHMRHNSLATTTTTTSSASTTTKTRSSRPNQGLTTEVVAQISEMKDEPQWMRDFRLRALEIFHEQADPDLGQRTAQGDRLRQHPLLRARDRPR